MVSEHEITIHGNLQKCMDVEWILLEMKWPVITTDGIKIAINCNQSWKLNVIAPKQSIGFCMALWMRLEHTKSKRESKGKHK